MGLPITAYLSVTPHIQPTHTGRTEDGGRHPAHFSPSRSYDVEESSEPVEALLDRFVELAGQAARAVEGSGAGASRLRKAVASGDGEEAGREREATWNDLRRAFGTRWASRVKPATLKLLMRHRSLETTMRYYVDQDADDVAEELWAAMRPSVGTFVGTRRISGDDPVSGAGQETTKALDKQGLS